MFAMMGIVEQVAVLVIPSIYSIFYSKLVEVNDANVIYIFYLSSAILLLSLVMYL